MTFSEYLQSRDHSAATICTYEKYLTVFTGWLEAEYIHPDGVCCEELLSFMRWLQAGGRSRETVAMLLCVVRHFYDWRIAIKATGSNPAAGVYIKGIPRRLPAGMLEEETLHELYRNYCQLYASTLCGRVILGLLVFQGLTVREIRQLEITDVRLEEGMLYVRGGRSYNGRRLKLDAVQVPVGALCACAREVIETGYARHAAAERTLPAGRSEQVAESLEKTEPCDQERAADPGQRDHGVAASLQRAAGAVHGRS